jgi:16S rRNA (uracil1498-N3)-methyltransferase
MSRPLRVFVPALSEGKLELSGESAHYALRVHRVTSGDALVLFDPSARTEADAIVIGTSRDRVRCEVGALRAGKVASLGGRLVQCVGKGDKVDEVIRAVTALGVAAITLAESERTVVKLKDRERADSRLERWRGVALDAARQCGRGDLPEITGPLALAEALAREPEGALKICLQPRAAARYGELLTARRGASPVTLLVGPEGGFSDAELSLAERSGFLLASFGEFELRTELAGVAALGALLALQPARG